MDSELRELMTVLFQSQNRLTERMIDLTATVDGFIASSDAYVKASNERIILVEKQLDAFLRAISGKPTNGNT